MKPLKLPPCSLHIKEGPGGRLVYDALRKKYVTLTPEEWVRQHFVNYLVSCLGYPAGLIQVEASFRLNSMLRRADILVCDRTGQPAMIIECKAPHVRINSEVFDQIINYNFSYGVEYLVVTNGITHFAGRVDRQKHKFVLLDYIPDYETVINSQS